jgi:hypothetical protein
MASYLGNIFFFFLVTVDLPSFIDITTRIDSELEVEFGIGTLGSTPAEDVEEPPL